MSQSNESKWIAECDDELALRERVQAAADSLEKQVREWEAGVVNRWRNWLGRRGAPRCEGPGCDRECDVADDWLCAECRDETLPREGRAF